MTVEAAPWPDRRRTGPAVGDTVELRDVRYRITALHPTDEGPLARLQAIGGRTFVMARELAWDGAVWRHESEARTPDEEAAYERGDDMFGPPTEAELREAWGK